MKTIFSTDEVHPRDRFDYWHSVACRTLVVHDSTPTCRQTFSAQLRRGALAEIGLFVFDTDAFRRRAPTLARFDVGPCFEHALRRCLVGAFHHNGGVGDGAHGSSSGIHVEQRLALLQSAGEGGSRVEAL